MSVPGSKRRSTSQKNARAICENDFVSYSATLTLVASSCDTVGEPVEFSKVCCRQHKKKTGEMSGFRSDKGGVFFLNIGGGSVKCGLKLTETPGGETNISADIVQGTSVHNFEKIEPGFKKKRHKGSR